MLQLTELAGFIGAGLAGAAYVPQIWHLIAAHCSAGLSRLAFGVWLASSVLVTSHAVALRAGVFIALGAIQVVATALICFYAARFRNVNCATHAPRPQVVGSGRRRLDEQTASEHQGVVMGVSAIEGSSGG